MPALLFLNEDPQTVWAKLWALLIPDDGPPLTEYWATFVSWLSQPDVLAVIIAWAVTFTLIVAMIMCLGFGPVGVLPASLAAAWQSWMYGAFTPAGGIFATLTSLAMLGLFMPVVAAIASLFATLVAAMVWVYGVGR